MSNFIDLTGQKFGRLTVVKRAKNKGSCTVWECLCDCGNITAVRAYDLKIGRTKSCGCYNMEHITKHGHSHDRLYNIWRTAKSRCTNPQDKDFERYGARGIVMCNEWTGSNGLENFIGWSMSNGYQDNLSIDRIDNSKGYSPDNCRWVTMKKQQNNRRNNHIITYNGKSQTISQWSEELGIKHSTLLYRIDSGWSVEKALNTPVKRYNKN